MKKLPNLKLSDEENDLLLEIDQRPEIFNLINKLLYGIIDERESNFVKQWIDLAQPNTQSNLLQSKMELQGMYKLVTDFSNLKEQAKSTNIRMSKK